MARLKSEAVTQAVARLSADMGKAAAKLAALIDATDDRVALAAAKTVLEMAFKARAAEEIEKKLQDLTDRLGAFLWPVGDSFAILKRRRPSRWAAVFVPPTTGLLPDFNTSIKPHTSEITVIPCVRPFVLARSCNTPANGIKCHFTGFCEPKGPFRFRFPKPGVASSNLAEGIRVRFSGQRFDDPFWLAKANAAAVRAAHF